MSLATHEDYAERQRKQRNAWLTPVDEESIHQRVRKAAFSFDSEKDISRKVDAEAHRISQEMEYARGEFSTWLSKLLRLATDEIIDVRDREKHGVMPLTSYREKVEMHLADQEGEQTEDWKYDREAHEMARKVLQLTAYQIFTFRQTVLEAAADAARDEAEALLDGEDVGRSLSRSVSEAAAKWVQSWKKSA